MIYDKNILRIEKFVVLEQRFDAIFMIYHINTFLLLNFIKDTGRQNITS